MSKPKIYIDGKEGTTGLQIYERLGGRDDIELLLIDEDKRKDVQARKDLLNAADLVFLCLPDAAAVEELFFNTNVSTAIHVGHGRGVMLLAGAKAGIPVFEYTPMQVKQAVVGYGRAEKKQVQQMTKMLLHLKEVPRPDDTADALALAVCHAHASGSRLCTLSPR